MYAKMRNELHFAKVGLRENINQHLIHLKTIIVRKLNPLFLTTRCIPEGAEGKLVSWEA